MIGKASEFKTALLMEHFGGTIQDEIIKWQTNNLDMIVIDIKFAIMSNGENSNEVYREALVIYTKRKMARFKP